MRLADGRRVLLGRVRAGVVIDARPGDPLGAAVRAAWSPAEVREREERRELGRAGIDPPRLAGAEAGRAVLALLRSLAAGRFPEEPERRAFYLALSAGQDRELARVGARVLAEFRSRRVMANMRVPDDLYWQLARFLRTAGQLREAVAVSDVLHEGSLRDPGSRKVLATTRVGTLLDLFETTREEKWRPLAERAVKVAYALGPQDDEVKAVYRRLDALRNRAGRRA